jgi:hypothetical protein
LQLEHAVEVCNGVLGICTTCGEYFNKKQKQNKNMNHEGLSGLLAQYLGLQEPKYQRVLPVRTAC